MTCQHTTAATTTELMKRTQLGYRTFLCAACHRQFNERTDTPNNYLEFPTDIVLMVVVCRLRYKLSLRDLPEMFLDRGFEFTHEAFREWEERFTPLMAHKLWTKRQGQSGWSWHADETYIKVRGVWKYLYRAIDRDGNLVDSMLSEKRDMEVAKRFFRQALEIAEQAPERVTTDGHDSYPRVIRETLGLGEEVMHRCNQYLNNRLEQDHCSIKQRYYPTRGFESVEAASRFCRAFDEQQEFFRAHHRMGCPTVSGQRQEFCARWRTLMTGLMAS